MKLELIGFIERVGAIEPLKKGFRQVNILWQPEVKDDLDRVKFREQYFQVQIWSESQTDSRFLSSKHMKEKRKCTVYLKGERWLNEQQREFNYALKLNLAEWK